MFKDESRSRVIVSGIAVNWQTISDKCKRTEIFLESLLLLSGQPIGNRSRAQTARDGVDLDIVCVAYLQNHVNGSMISAGGV